MPRLSLVLIVKNEAAHLARCLESAKNLVDEIVIVDSGSTDNSAEIAAQFGARWYSHTDWQGFGKQRRIAQQYATGDYILWLDADEYLSETLEKSIRAAVNRNEPRAYTLNRLSQFLGKKIRHSGWYPDRVVRLYPRDLGQYGDVQVHESVQLKHGTPIEHLKGDLNHKTCTSLEQFHRKSDMYAQLWAKQKRMDGKRASIMQATLHALGCFLRMYILRRGFLDGRHGFVLAVLSSQAVFSKYIYLWFLSHKKSDNLE